MKLIKLPRLRLAQLQSLAVNTLIMCKNLVQFAASLLGIENTLKAFKEGMQKDEASAERKSELDQIRDSRLSGFFAVVFAENKFPNEDETVLNAYEKLLKIARKYGPGIRRLPRDEETIMIDNMLEEIGEIDLAPLEVTGIPRWIPTIAAANSEYKEEATEYISDSVESDSTETASKHAPVLEEALEKLYTEIFATITLSPSKELKKIYAKFEKLIDSMK